MKRTVTKEITEYVCDVCGAITGPLELRRCTTCKRYACSPCRDCSDYNGYHCNECWRFGESFESRKARIEAKARRQCQVIDCEFEVMAIIALCESGKLTGARTAELLGAPTGAFPPDDDDDEDEDWIDE